MLIILDRFCYLLSMGHYSSETGRKRVKGNRNGKIHILSLNFLTGGNKGKNIDNVIETGFIIMNGGQG